MKFQRYETMLQPGSNGRLTRSGLHYFAIYPIEGAGL